MDLKIAICEDDALQSQALKREVTLWANERNVGVSVFGYPNAESFLFDYSEDQSFDILLLDIEMGKVSGIDLAKEIRKSNPTVQIVFTTGYYQYFSAGFDVSALHYLIKPITKEKLAPVLDKAVSNLSYRQRSVLIENPDGVFRIPLSDILFIESDRMHSVIHTVREVYRTRKGISQIEPLLSENFFRVHRSFIVNLSHVSKITKTEATLSSGDAVPIARGNYDTVYSELIKRL
ncbi:MAG: response regulator transcription factor [Clostridia bacterium]|nr:response regulator transcription factor [Clostridia bacterium]